MGLEERLFETKASLASALAFDVSRALEAAITRHGRAVLAVSGGKTPALFFENLSRSDIDWKLITVTLVDERCVPDSDERSNDRFLHEHLLKNRAAAAAFVPLYDNPAANDIAAFDVTVLGMGADGHTASYFPGADRLAEATSPQAPKRLIKLRAPNVPEQRITFTLPDLTQAGHLFLHIEGEEKMQVLRRALAEGPVEDLPVRSVLRSGRPVILYWCP